MKKLLLFVLLVCIKQINAQVITTVAGGPWSLVNNNGSATNAILVGASGVATDAMGNVYIANTIANVIQKVNTSGIISTVAGNGTLGYSGDGIAATNAELNAPTGVTVDTEGNIYIADQANNRIRMVSTSGIISTFAGQANYGYSVNGGAATTAELYQPYGVFTDAVGNVFFSDEGNNRLRKVNTNGIITTIAGGGSVGNGIPATSSYLAQPQGVAMDMLGNIYTTDATDNQIRKINSNGIISLFAGTGNANSYGDGGPATSAALYGPQGIATDAAGNVYIADSKNNRIRMINTNGVISTFAGNTGLAGYSGDGGTASSAKLNMPVGITVDITGNVYIIDQLNYCIRKINTNGIISTFAGNGVGANTGDGGLATNAGLNFPFSQAIDATGNIYVVDCANNSIRKVSTNGIITTVAGNGIAGFSGDGGNATNAQLKTPSGVAVDAVGNLYIADSKNNRIRMINTNGIISTFAGNGTADYAGNGGQATAAEINTPYGITVDTKGNVYFSEGGNNVIRKVNTAGIISTFAGASSYGNSGDFGGDGGGALGALLNTPIGIVIDTSGNMYIADSDNQRIRKVNTTGIISTVAGKGIYSFSGDGGLATNATLYNPFGVAVDMAGNLFIADLTNNRIRVVNTSGIISTFAGNGTGGYYGDGGLATNAEINVPYGVATDVLGNVYIADRNNQSIRKVTKCTSPISVNITASNTIVCAGGSVNLTGSGATIYTWNSPSGTSTVNPYMVNPTANTTYTLSGVTGGCLSSNTITITVNPLPVISVNAVSICLGTTATLTASGASTYTWSTNETGVSISPSPTITTNYTVTGTDGNGCTNSNTSTVVVNPLPTILVHADTICAGTTATLTVSGASTYTWNTTEIGTTISPSPTVTSNYTVTGTDGNGCINTATSTVSVNSLPVITISSTDISCYGLSDGTATASVSGGSPSYSYTWSPSGGNSATASSLTLGNYSVTVTDINNCVNSASVSINQPPTLSVSATQTAKDCGSNNGQALGVVSGGTSAYSYTWNPTSQTLSSATGLAGGITYTFLATDANGCVGSASVFVSDSCDMVWAGDANNDLVADNNDILAIGIGNATSGTTRVNATRNWTAQPTANWTNTLTDGTNYKHIDCDGNGTIDLNDTGAVIQNFSLTHPASRLANPNQTYAGGAPITLIPQQNYIMSGGTGVFDIILGDNTNMVNNAYGIAFTMQFDNTYIDGTSISINGNGSWLGSINNNMMAIALKGTSQTEFAITKTDHNNVNGKGKIGEITFKALANINTNPTTGFSINTANLISYNQTNIPVDLSAATATVTIINGTTGVNQLAANNEQVSIYPNPNNGTFTIETNSVTKQTLHVYDLNGKLVLTQIINGKATIDANSLVDGIYNISLTSNKSIVNKRMVIVR